jgi:hypothetical protein
MRLQRLFHRFQSSANLCHENVGIANPTHVFITLRAVSRNMDKIDSNRSHDAGVKLIQEFISAFKASCSFHITAYCNAGDGLGF